MATPLLVNPLPPPEMHIDHNVLSPRLLHGETKQGIMTAKFKHAKTVVENISRRDQGASQIRLLL